MTKDEAHALAKHFHINSMRGLLSDTELKTFGRLLLEVWEKGREEGRKEGPLKGEIKLIEDSKGKKTWQIT